MGCMGERQALTAYPWRIRSGKAEEILRNPAQVVDSLPPILYCLGQAERTGLTTGPPLALGQHNPRGQP
jgi:hypothetical protein